MDAGLLLLLNLARAVGRIFRMYEKGRRNIGSPAQYSYVVKSSTNGYLALRVGVLNRHLKIIFIKINLSLKWNVEENQIIFVK